MLRLRINKFSPPSPTLWLLDGSLVRDDDLAFFTERIGVRERHRYAGFTRRERQRQFVLGRMLLRFAVAALTRLSPDALGVVERPGNAPELMLPDGQCLIPYFSLAHSRDWVGCVVSSDARLGLDIEVNDPNRDVAAIGEFALHPNEQRWLLRQPQPERRSAFYQLWSTREALYKLASGLDCGIEASSLVAANDQLASQGCRWHRYTLPHHGLTVVVCSDRPLPTLREVELTGLTRSDWLAARRDGQSFRA